MCTALAFKGARASFLFDILSQSEKGLLLLAPNLFLSFFQSIHTFLQHKNPPRYFGTKRCCTRGNPFFQGTQRLGVKFFHPDFISWRAEYRLVGFGNLDCFLAVLVVYLLTIFRGQTYSCS
jgi:hypothetical protein